MNVQADQPPIWTLGSDHYLHFPIASPKSNEFLLWSISVSSDNEDEDWVADSEFRDWVILKTSNDLEGGDDNSGGIEGGGGTLLLMTLDKQNENKQNLIGNSKEEGLAIFSAVEAEERTFESDVIILEDKNAPEELANDPLNKFRALLNHQITQTPKIQQKQPFGINTGLKSPREVYFGIKNGRKSVCGGYRGILGISDVDMALYSKYSMAASSVFERHNLRRQKQPTAWKLPNPLKNLQKMVRERISLSLIIYISF
uniref:Uncharacterized protein n=1 Tax=Meloidogyne javanica TaxID=6303 RepID=A0A915ND04_MELJA